MSFVEMTNFSVLINGFEPLNFQLNSINPGLHKINLVVQDGYQLISGL